MQQFIDTHCHLTDEPLFGRLPEVIAKARQQRVMEIIVPAYDLPSGFAAAKLSAEEKDIFFGLMAAWEVVKERCKV